MYKYILKRLLMVIPVIVGVTFIIFSLSYITPGDPADFILGDSAPREAKERLREELGLNDPFFVRYANFIINAVQGDLGQSYNTRRSVSDEILARFPTTMHLAGMGLALAVFLGVTLGVISATKQYSIFDNLATVFGLVFVSIPNFWLGMMMVIIFAVNLKWFPPSGFSSPIQWVLPTVTLGTGQMAAIMRMSRSSMLEVVRQDYIRTARSKGQKESVVIWKHALRNALIPVTTYVGLTFGFLLAGAVLTETIFSINGMGRFMVQSVMNRDLPIMLGGVLILSVAFSLVNLLVDILYAYLDPRIKSQYK